ncbi:MAG: hypothetical protein AAF928_22125 [Myxococcota bacterium]
MAPPPHGARAERLNDGTCAGRPAGFRPDAAPAFWIWQGPRGNWRVRTTNGGGAKTFRGLIHGVSGPIVAMRPSRDALRERVWVVDRTPGDNRSWAFSFASDIHADGFIFAAEGNGCVRFDLKDITDAPGASGTDAAARPVVYLGARQVRPRNGHFMVCPRGVSPTTGTGRRARPR